MKEVVPVMGKLRLVLELVAIGLIYSLIVSFVTLAVLFLISQNLSGALSLLPLVLLLEGGIVMAVGGAIASFSPTFGRLGESLLRSKSWDAKRQSEAERQARTWIGTGVLLVLIGFLVSAF